MRVLGRPTSLHLFKPVAGLLLAALLAPAAAAQVAPRQETPLDAARVLDPRLLPSPRLAPGAAPGEVSTEVAPEVRNAWEGFRLSAGGEWQAQFDAASGRLAAAEGAGIPWIPGRGNRLTLADLAPLLAGKPEPDLATLESIARNFLGKAASLLGTGGSTLVLDRGRSGRFSDYLWYVDFGVERGGLPVEGAHVVCRVNHGNLVQFGAENLPDPGAPVPVPELSREEALAALAQHVGGFDAKDSWVDPGSLRLLPAVERGRRGLLAAWQFTFRRKGVTGTWRGRVEATSGAVIELLDVNAYAGATGGVFPSSPAAGAETLLPMPFADLSSGGAADSAGLYPFDPAGGPVTSTLAGPYVRIFDQCGPVSLSSTPAGNLRFRSSAGTNCATPGVGGAGNTHSARTQFFHLNRIKEAARGWLPGNTWLPGQLTANVNLTQATCNAYWNGDALLFYRSGGGCGNTGELAGISLHEFGHGLDQNDGAGVSSDLGSGEAYADVVAALALRDSCLGPGFHSGNCGAYGDACTSCSGVRDIDWARHASNTPHTVANFVQPRCSFGFYPGPCGGEGHCESHVASEAIWDLAARDLPDPGSAGAWSVAERLWYLSRPTATHAYTCNTSTATWTSNGCAAGSWWRTLRAVDDDDGNLANGTPHSCRLFAAFDRHGIACATDPGASVCASACTPPAAPVVTLTPGEQQIALSWTSAGPGVVYDVYRGDTGCGTGKVRIANDLAGTSLLDPHVASRVSYAYEVIAHPAGSEACAAAPSACQTATPVSPPCTPPAAPVLSAVSTTFGRVDLSWTAPAGAFSYQLARGTAAGGPYLPIATLTGTTFADRGLDDATTYYYVVRAGDVDDCTSADSAEAAVTTPVCHQVTLYENDFEAGEGLDGWTVATLPGHTGASDWRGIQDCAAHGGTQGFRFGGPACDLSYHLGQATYAQLPAIEVLPGAGRVRLSFWHRWSLGEFFDGGTLTLALDGGAPVQVPDAALSGTFYNGFLSDGTPVFNNFEGHPQDSFVQTVVDLDRACNAASGGSGGCAGHTVAIRFVALISGTFGFSGWILDDVEVTACGPDCAAPGAPAGTSAVPAGDNHAQVSWSNGAPAAATFNVYRAPGTCAAPGAFRRVAQRVAGPPVTDAGLQGTLTYAYRVTGNDTTGFCESAPSPCAEVTATGPCTLAPTFAGLASATNPQTAVCALDLAWNPATLRCPAAVTYDVFRSAVPSFVPAATNRIASGLTGTSYHDASPLADHATFWYVVRAVNALSGAADGNFVRRSAAPSGPPLAATLSESFEAADGFDLDGWEHRPLSGLGDWSWSGQRFQSPSHSWFSPSQGSSADRILLSPRFVPGPATELRFWHTYEFENPANCFDGGTLEISTDDGASWDPVPASAFLAGVYSGSALAPAIQGEPAWCGGTLGAMTEVRAVLSAWQGQEVRLRWHGAEDGSVKYTGWFVDSVTISDATAISVCSAAPIPAASFYTVAPCRLLDTRQAFAPLQPNEVRTLALLPGCNIPETAVALSVNLTVTQTTAAGHLTLFPADRLPPQASTINFSAGQTRANNALLALPPDGRGSVKVRATTAGTVYLIVDVNGYFQ